VYFRPDGESERRLQAIRERLETAFSLPKISEDGVFRPHLTIGEFDIDFVDILEEKAKMLLPISWSFESLVVINKNDSDGGRMEVFAAIPERNTSLVPSASSSLTSSPCCYSYNESAKRWELYQPSSLFDILTPTTTLTISTYNILHSPPQPQTRNSPRLPLLLNIILQQPSTILVLQEVTDTSWNYFLSTPALRTKFPYISSSADLPLPNHRNIVILSTIPFKAYYLPLTSPHKPSLVADFATFMIAGVHLSSGLHEEKLSMKHKELTKLVAHLHIQCNSRPVILAGDFNIPKQGREYTAALPKVLEVLEQYEDAWQGGEDTFCPAKNRFAMEGAGSLVSQRYDRVLYTREMGKVFDRQIFGVPEREEDLASDHWGISVTLKLSPEPQAMDTFSDATSVKVSTEILGIPETNWTDDEISNTLQTANIIPTSTHDTGILTALSHLQDFLTPLQSQIPFLLQPLGSFALGAHTNSSDLDILAVSTISPTTFWTLFLQHLYRYKVWRGGNRIKLLRVIWEAKAPMVELRVDGFAFEVLYCAAGRLIPMYFTVCLLVFPSWKFHTLQCLYSFRYLITSLVV